MKQNKTTGDLGRRRLCAFTVIAEQNGHYKFTEKFYEYFTSGVRV